MSQVLKIRKVAVLPATFEGSTLYLVKSANNILFDMYLSTDTGSSVRRIISEADINGKIAAAVAAFNSVDIVANIAARNALNPTVTRQVLVVDATGDATVTQGSATYIYNTTNSTWVKVSESESMDVTLKWANIQNAPTSSVAAIDDAVTKAHTHSNKTVLDGITDTGGHLYYQGAPVRTYLEEEGW